MSVIAVEKCDLRDAERYRAIRELTLTCGDYGPTLFSGRLSAVDTFADEVVAYQKRSGTGVFAPRRAQPDLAEAINRLNAEAEKFNMLVEQLAERCGPFR